MQFIALVVVIIKSILLFSFGNESLLWVDAYGIRSSVVGNRNPPQTTVRGSRLYSVVPVHNNNNNNKHCNGQPSSMAHHLPIDSETNSYPQPVPLPKTMEAEDDTRSVPNQHHLFLPQHVGFVCDGNSRWAQARGLPAAMGHMAGANRFVDILNFLLRNNNIRYYTLFGFSTENWQRPETEIAEIFRAMECAAHRVRDQLSLPENQNIRLQVLGDIEDSRIPQSLRDILLQLQDETQQQQDRIGNISSARDTTTVCLAINYGGRQDIVNASKRLAMDIANGIIHPDHVSEADFSKRLSTHNVPDPDLIIRTSGERRLSNFLLWESAYAELYFTDTLWPDFDESAMEKALDWYSQRRRRFGGR